MRKSLFLMALLATGGLALSSYAQKPDLQAEDGGLVPMTEGVTDIPADWMTRIAPLAIAPIDEFGNIIGEWVEAGVAEDCGAYLCYDAVGTDTRTQLPGDGFYGLNCGMGSSRFRAGGDTNQDRVIVEDFIGNVGACNGGLIGRMEYAFWWQVGGTGTSERLVLFVELRETWENSGNCTSTGFLSGFVADFGVLPSSKDVGYYAADICLAGLPQTAPADGAGAYKITMAKDELGTLSTLAQPMLWGDSQPQNEGNSARRHFSDLDNDGVVDSGECKSYNLGMCIDPLGTMTAFWRHGVPTTPKLRANCRANGTMIARAKNFGPTGTTVNFKLDGGPNNNSRVRPSGRCNARWTGNVAGSPHTVSATTATLGWTLYRNTTCE